MQVQAAGATAACGSWATTNGVRVEASFVPVEAEDDIGEVAVAVGRDETPASRAAGSRDDSVEIGGLCVRAA